MKRIKEVKEFKPINIDKVLSAKESIEQNEFIQAQKRFKDVVLSKMYKGAELLEIEKQLKEDNIKIMWRGMICPKNILIMECDIIRAQYFEFLSEENYLIQALTNFGLKKEEIEDIVRKGKLFKELPKQKKIKESYIT